jgi:hypothetical protein
MVSVRYFKVICLVLLFLLAKGELEANNSRRYPKHQFGLGFSSISGAGLTYQLDVSKVSSLQTNFFAYYQGEEPPDKVKLYANIGLEYQYNLFNDRETRYYLFSGASYWLIEKRDYKLGYVNDILTKLAENDLQRLYNFGLGIGYEIKFWGHAAFSASLGLQIQKSDESNLDKLFDRNPSGTSFFGLGGGIGIRYTF